MKSKNFKKLFAVALAVVVIITAVPMYAFATETTEFAGGNGTESDPYLISTKEHLNNVRQYQSAHYKMTADVVFEDSDFAVDGAFYNEGKGWTPIPNFKGVFDGDGHTVENMQIAISNSSTYIYAGLFGENIGTIKNLGMTNGNIFINCTKYIYVGSIAGQNKGKIDCCYNTGTISVNTTEGSYAGGITGKSYGTIVNCYNIGVVNATNDTSSYAHAGGIAGVNNGTISTCYNIGVSSSSDYTFGAITGSYSDDNLNCYYLDNMNEGTAIGDNGTTKLTSDHMKVQKTFGGFDFDNIWTMAGDTDYPYPELKNVPMDFTKEFIGICIHTMPNKTEYYSEIEDFNVIGGQIKVIYNDGTYTVVDMTKDMVTGYDKNKVGSQTLTVTYKGKTTTFDVNCKALVYDFKITTDEQLTLEYQAKTTFDFVLSDNSIAKITDVSSSSIIFGSSVEMHSSATIVPLKPGYVVVKVVDKSDKMLTQSLVWIEEGNHKFKVEKEIIPATCTTVGKAECVCEFCGIKEERIVEALGHTEVIDEAVPATCTTTGKTEGSHCSICNAVIKEQLAVAIIPHPYGAWTVTKPATSSQTGIETRTCSACGHKETRAIETIALMGDANGDGSITAVDARIVLQIVAGLYTYTGDETVIDLNADGNVTAVDARIILQMVAGLL